MKDGFSPIVFLVVAVCFLVFITSGNKTFAVSIVDDVQRIALAKNKIADFCFEEVFNYDTCYESLTANLTIENARDINLDTRNSILILIKSTNTKVDRITY